MAKWGDEGNSSRNIEYNQPVQTVGIAVESATSKVIDFASDILESMEDQLFRVNKALSISEKNLLNAKQLITAKDNAIHTYTQSLQEKEKTIANLSNELEILKKYTTSAAAAAVSHNMNATPGMPYNIKATSAPQNPDSLGYFEDISDRQFVVPIVYDDDIGTESIDEDSDMLNPMECFIIFLQDENILDLFVKATEAADVTFDDLVDNVSPSEYIAYGTTGSSMDVADGWSEVDVKWNNVVTNLNINELEAWL